jgi:hypothetical protein
MLNHLNSNILRNSIIALRHLSLIFARGTELIIISSREHKYKKCNLNFKSPRRGRYIIRGAGKEIMIVEGRK